MKSLTKNEKRKKRQIKVRSRISGTASRPRLVVFKSLVNMTAQLVDDENSKILASVHSKKVKQGDAGERKGKVAKSYLVGKKLSDKAKELKIEEIVFDRAGFKYHGRVAAVAEGARDGGLKF